jgi:glycosyltransferase involved in cell wall biosynthesis
MSTGSTDVTTIGVDGRELTATVPTGIARYACEVIAAAVRAGHECVVYTDRPIAPGRLAPSPGLRVTLLPGAPTVWWDQRILPRALRRDRADVLLSPYYKLPVLAPCPVVVTIHDLFFIGYPGRRRPVHDRIVARLARLYASRAAAIVTDSHHSRRAILDRLGADPRKIRVVPVAVGAEFRPVPDPATPARYGIRAPYVLYVGNFMPHKNVERLVEAYAALPDALRRSHALVLAGGDTARRAGLEGLVARLGLDRRVVFTGAIAAADLPRIYSGASVFVLPSLEEGFGLPAVEAMACGVPVIVSDRGALPEVVGSSALVVSAGSVAEIADAVQRVLTTPELAARLSADGVQHVCRFTPDHTAARVVALLEDVAAARVPVPAGSA